MFLWICAFKGEHGLDWAYERRADGTPWFLHDQTQANSHYVDLVVEEQEHRRILADPAVVFKPIRGKTSIRLCKIPVEVFSEFP